MQRRHFHKLSIAALSGAVAGTLAGCGGETPAPAPAQPAPGTPSAASKDSTPVVAETHLCRGLNACKNQGASGKNDCAGQGDCASKATHHTCGGANECKGQGGCGKNAGENECKGKGGCEVPLMDSAWKKVRARFEEKMKKDNKPFGSAPEKAKA